MKIFMIYLGMAAVGYLIATPFRKYKNRLKWIGTLLSIVVLTLVFAMGFRIGSNESIIRELGTIGLYSFIFAVVPLTATIFVLHLVRKAMGFDHQGIYRKTKQEKNATMDSEEEICDIPDSA